MVGDDDDQYRIHHIIISPDLGIMGTTKQASTPCSSNSLPRWPATLVLMRMVSRR